MLHYSKITSLAYFFSFERTLYRDCELLYIYICFFAFILTFHFQNNVLRVQIQVVQVVCQPQMRTFYFQMMTLVILLNLTSND